MKMTHAAVVERDLSSLPFANLEVLIDEVVAIDTLQKRVHLKNGGECTYDRLCICTGAVPKVRILLQLCSWGPNLTCQGPPARAALATAETYCIMCRVWQSTLQW